jgi:formate hydrogenlyase transcriptional activator
MNQKELPEVGTGVFLNGSHNAKTNGTALNGSKHSEETTAHDTAGIEKVNGGRHGENDYLQRGINLAEPCWGIVGESRAINRVLDQVRMIASTNSTVLICGETGVGKRLIAEAIHSLSPRMGNKLITVNCAALPPQLVESELFGRETGAFASAMAYQPGRLDIADRSTIFLDEIGGLAPETQAKLLRVLQEGCFERPGSHWTVRVNVRLIAATNRDLAEEARGGRLRQDLFYRLNVFPIKVPPLRERVEDIPVLVWSFVEEFSMRMGKKITRISRKTMDALQRYTWPGNVRELRNVIERSVIISTGETLRIAYLQDLYQATQPTTLAEVEREHILRMLETSMWHIKGPRGAAIKLGLKPSTLYTRMHKLGIPTFTQREGRRDSIVT